MAMADFQAIDVYDEDVHDVNDDVKEESHFLRKKTHSIDDSDNIHDLDARAAQIQKRCVALSECMMCSSSDFEVDQQPPQDENEVPLDELCLVTGRRQRFDCAIETRALAGGRTVPSRHIQVWKSCASTPADDLRQVVLMQIFCLVFGVISSMVVSRQKRMHASLFDQRRYAAAAVASSKSSQAASSSTSKQTLSTPTTKRTTRSAASDEYPGSGSKVKDAEMVSFLPSSDASGR